MNVPDLGQLKQLQQQRQAAMKDNVIATAQQIYVKLAAHHLNTGYAAEPCQCRDWAEQAWKAAPYIFEAAGLLKVNEEAQCQQP